jgi:fatty acid amide hydrolase
MVMILRWPFWLRRLVSILLLPINNRAAKIIGTFHKSTRELLLVYQEIEAYWMTWKKLFQDQRFDCLICPIFVSLLVRDLIFSFGFQPVPAMLHKEPYKLTFNCSYTGLFNLLDYPAGSLPVTKVTQADIDSLQHYPASDMFERMLANSARVRLSCIFPYEH